MNRKPFSTIFVPLNKLGLQPKCLAERLSLLSVPVDRIDDGLVHRSSFADRWECFCNAMKRIWTLSVAGKLQQPDDTRIMRHGQCSKVHTNRVLDNRNLFVKLMTHPGIVVRSATFLHRRFHDNESTRPV